jgi:ankyrin repeat protein
VVCQVDELRRCFPASIRDALADLPESLDKTYERTLWGIDKQKRKYAQRLLQCLSVSIRPLRVDELADIFAVQFDTTASPSSLFNKDLRPLDAEEAVLLACSSLIAVVDREGGQIVQFSHFSVKEFLTSNRLATTTDERLSCYHILPERAHTLLARAGLSVLLRLDDKIDRNAIGHFPLAPYAARYWVDHAQFGNGSFHIDEVMECLFDPAKPHFAAWVWLYDIDHHWVKPMSSTHPTRPEAVPLYYAALCGFGSFVKRLIVSHSADINSRGGSHTTPLHAAAVKGHVEVTSVLLESGADPNSRDDLARTPLHRVSQGGEFVMEQSSLEIARLLINSGANVNLTSDDCWTPLHAASKKGYHEIAQHLLVSGASLDARNHYQETPLHLSCANGKLEVSRLLIDCGSDLKSRDGEGFNLLHMASANGHLEIARLLIDHGANVDSRSDKGGETPLDSAAGEGRLDVVRFLIESGAVVSARDKNGWTPFHTASSFGHLHA